MKKISSFADEMIIASATSSRHAKALSDRVVEDLKSNNILVLGVEGQDTSDWILIDCEDLVINIMNNETRVYYCLLYTSPSPRDVRSSRMPSSA